MLDGLTGGCVSDQLLDTELVYQPRELSLTAEEIKRTCRVLAHKRQKADESGDVTAGGEVDHGLPPS